MNDFEIKYIKEVLANLKLIRRCKPTDYSLDYLIETMEEFINDNEGSNIK